MTKSKYTLQGFFSKKGLGSSKLYISVRDNTKKTKPVLIKPLDKEDLNKFHKMTYKDKHDLVNKYFK